MNVIETRRKYSRYLRIFYVFAVIAFVATTLSFVTVIKKNLALKKEINALQADISDKKKAFDVQSLEKQWRDYIWKLKTINLMMNGRSLWGNRLKELANMLPAGMCISNIVVSEEQGGKIKYYIELMAVQSEQKGFKQVDGYINAIESNKYFGKGVKVQSHERRMLNGKEVEIFQITLPSGPAK